MCTGNIAVMIMTNDAQSDTCGVVACSEDSACCPASLLAHTRRLNASSALGGCAGAAVFAAAAVFGCGETAPGDIGVGFTGGGRCWSSPELLRCGTVGVVEGVTDGGGIPKNGRGRGVVVFDLVSANARRTEEGTALAVDAGIVD